MISLIWAMTKDGVIGDNNKLPWKIKSEMQYFKNLTINKTVLMGSKTLLSMGHPLKSRKNIVITNNPQKLSHFASKDCIIISDLNKIISQYQGNNNKHIFVIGGAEVYYQTFPFADFLYVSIIKNNYQGNIHFPILDFSQFQKISSVDNIEFTAEIYQRKEK